jgi:hypothetical protein
MPNPGFPYIIWAAYDFEETIPPYVPYLSSTAISRPLTTITAGQPWPVTGKTGYGVAESNANQYSEFNGENLGLLSWFSNGGLNLNLWAYFDSTVGWDPGIGGEPAAVGVTIMNAGWFPILNFQVRKSTQNANEYQIFYSGFDWFNSGYEPYGLLPFIVPEDQWINFSVNFSADGTTIKINDELIAEISLTVAPGYNPWDPESGVTDEAQAAIQVFISHGLFANASLDSVKICDYKLEGSQETELFSGGTPEPPAVTRVRFLQKPPYILRRT